MVRTDTADIELWQLNMIFPGDVRDHIKTSILNCILHKDAVRGYTCTVVVISVPETFVLQVCGRHRKTYGPGCLCLPVSKVLLYLPVKNGPGHWED